MRLIKATLILISFVLLVWLIFFPYWHFYWATTCAVLFLPAMVIANLIFKNTFEIREPKFKPLLSSRINLFDPLFISTLGLALIFAYPVPYGFQILNFLHFFILATIIFCILTAVIWVCFRGHGNLSSIAGLMIFYSLFLTGYLNEIGPISTEVVSKGLITEKFKQIKGLGNTFVIGTNTMKNRVGVTKSDYEKYAIGMEACAKNVTGWLGITTRTFIECNTALTPPSSGTR
ncbi:hypothetical protein INP77_03900 [Methylophilus sp. 13]|uniref:hypothetical protein n=1 Tax=Methylophilus sp. 13 TaxID=2781018 RepID=UPI00188FFFE8|nr:hypothetical protein [Methylophilus sp. 13]MBF5038634.1 hypothetical protein [Methylophilus sp. 13]